ncbi:MAG: transcriptional regulator [Clostridia bacterium]|nr:transcriptional regulator [Clostridia bacterium]
MEERFELFTLLIAKANRLVYKIKTEEMVEFNLKSSHVSCLYYLYKAKELTAKAICDACGEDKANISRAIKYLEINGFLECESTAKKRYQSALTLTEKGVITASKIAQKIDAVLKKASEGLTEENRVIFYKSLSLICSNLEDVCNNYR